MKEGGCVAILRLDEYDVAVLVKELTFIWMRFWKQSDFNIEGIFLSSPKEISEN